MTIGSDSTRRRRRVGGVFVVESFVEKDLHGSSFMENAFLCTAFRK